MTRRPWPTRWRRACQEVSRMIVDPGSACIRKDRVRGRDAVLWGFVSFVALQAAYFPMADWRPQLQDAEYGEKLHHLRHQLAAKRKDQPCIIMAGSSLTRWAFNPSALRTVKPGAPDGPVVFNMALNSSGAVVQLLTLRRL